MVKVQPTIMAKEKVPADELAAVWSSSDTTKHNKDNGIPAYLSFIEKLPSDGGKFTSSGCTVGECKLFAVLHILVSIQPSVLASFPGVQAFYTRFAALEPTKGVLAGTLNMPGPWVNYFKKPE